MPAIVESLKEGVGWERVGVEKVYTACGAKEAKLVLTNFIVDVLICDIEMPEEDGLELVGWAKTHFPDLECIFLTAHAEFDYVQEALRLGSFDYILQPVKFDDVEKVILRVGEKIRKDMRFRRLESITRKVMSQGNNILEIMYTKSLQKSDSEADQLCMDYMEVCGYLFDQRVVYQAVLDIVRWKRITNRKNSREVCLILDHAVESLFEEENAKTAVAGAATDRYWILVVTDERKVTEEVWRQKITEFYEFAEKNMDFDVAIVPGDQGVREGFISVFRHLEEKGEMGGARSPGIYWDKTGARTRRGKNPVIEQALRYIESNMNRNLSRTEVAGAVNISEEYFSRLFKQETGDTFKDYILTVKMETAKELLWDTQLSVGIIASKVGYSNFSHFSQMFKSHTGMTPQEYRREGGK